MPIRKCNEEEQNSIEMICCQFEDVLIPLLEDEVDPYHLMAALQYLVAYVCIGSVFGYDGDVLDTQEAEMDALNEELAEAVDRSLTRLTERN